MQIREWRLANNLTQSSLAKNAGLATPYISQIETGSRRPSPEAAKRIEAATNGEVTAAELLGLKSGGVREDAAAFTPNPNIAKEARALGLDPDAIAAKAVEDAVKRKRIEAWNEENKDAIESWNAHYRKHGLWNEKYRQF